MIIVNKISNLLNILIYFNLNIFSNLSVPLSKVKIHILFPLIPSVEVIVVTLSKYISLSSIVPKILLI